GAVGSNKTSVAGVKGGGSATGRPIQSENDEAKASALNGKKTNASLEEEAGTYFGQQRKYWSREPIQYSGNKVYQRNDLIDPGRIDSQTGLTNKQLMEKGLAPYGADGNKINLHHMLQTQDGPIAEVTQSFHKNNTAAIHINSGSDIPSGINRAQFERWKKGYWKSRASDFN
ncbi:HNH/ENDO VII family nuclease, partial [Achromobacter xylosoxidans]